MSDPAAVPPTEPAPATGRASPIDRRRNLVAARERTPELELLISGAVLFALFRVSDLADETFFRALLNLGGPLRGGAIIAHEYVKLILYTLIVAFVAHLALRAWWVGLVGIDAAFPGGPRWDRLRNYGPAMLEVYRDRVPRVRRMMVATDTLASVVFATGLAFAGVFAFSVAAMIGFGLGAVALAAAVPGLRPQTAFLVLAGVVVGFMVLVGLVDKMRGERILASPAGAAWLRRVARIAVAMGGARLFAPISLVVTSNLPKRRVYTGIILGVGLVVALFVVRDVLFGYGLLGFDSHRYLSARPGAGGFDPSYYEVYRKPWGMEWRLPSLSSDVAGADDPYLRLFVPLSPERTENAVRGHCPEVAASREPGLRLERRFGEGGMAPAAAAALRDCLLRHTRVELDGRPLAGERFVLAVHPTSGARGLMAQLAMAPLPPGEHRVTVVEGRLPDERRPPRRHVIPFWR